MSASVFSICYVALALRFVLRSKEFESAGLTIEHLFDKLLGKEIDNFVLYHMRRTSVYQLVHSLLFSGYLLGLSYFQQVPILELTSIWWTAFVAFSFTLPLCIVVFSFLTWNYMDGVGHPLTTTLQKFAAANQSWQDVARLINNECMGLDTVRIQAGPLSTVVVTQNWLIELCRYSVNVVRQDSIELVVNRADAYQRTGERIADGEVIVQFINVEVCPLRPIVKPFAFRINSIDFLELQNSVHCRVTVLEGARFRKTTTERFLDVFIDTVNKNPPYEIPRNTASEIEKCIGCLQVQADVKLVKCCTQSEQCVNCMCRPLWCIECMGKWFASRQDQEAPETWLSSTCTCPICRSVFCILDVCRLKIGN
ncbi:Putative transmembrane protein precursor [Nesidiocoris tenuis]|nr:Putative transmembrane protein precursor [Nesidiocoris tenuis]